jgi:hypothetical protein
VSMNEKMMSHFLSLFYLPCSFANTFLFNVE